MSRSGDTTPGRAGAPGPSTTAAGSAASTADRKGAGA